MCSAQMEQQPSQKPQALFVATFIIILPFCILYDIYVGRYNFGTSAFRSVSSVNAGNHILIVGCCRCCEKQFTCMCNSPETQVTDFTVGLMGIVAICWDVQRAQVKYSHVAAIDVHTVST